MNGILPWPVAERTTPPALIDIAQKSAFTMKPVDRTNVKVIPLARIAASPRACHTPVPTSCFASIEESFTRCRTPAAFATFAASSSRLAISGPLLTRKSASIPASADGNIYTVAEPRPRLLRISHEHPRPLPALQQQLDNARPDFPRRPNNQIS